MRGTPNIRSLILPILCVSCASHAKPPSAQLARAAVDSGRSVFSDSLLHDRVCEPPRANEDWRSVCIPKDQRGLIPVPRKTP